jgi:hypothetical protein
VMICRKVRGKGEQEGGCEKQRDPFFFLEHTFYKKCCCFVTVT